MSIRYIALWLLAIVVSLSSCVSLVDTTSSSSPATVELNNSGAVLAQAEKSYRNGNYAQASQALGKYLKANPQSPDREYLLSLYGQSAEKAGQYSQAIEAYTYLEREFSGGNAANEASLHIPDLYLYVDPSKAKTLADSQIQSETDLARRSSLLLVSGKAQWILGRYQEALSAFLEVRNNSSGSLRQSAEEGVEGSLGRLSLIELSTIQRQYGQNYPGPEATWFLAYQMAQIGDQPSLASQIAYFRRYFPDHPWLSSLNALETDPRGQTAHIASLDYNPRPLPTVSRPATETPTIITDSSRLPSGILVAAILPLTGDSSSRYAQDVLDGLKLALASVDDRIGLVVMDSQGLPGQVVRLIGEVAARPEILAVVGPLSSREALAAAQSAQDFSLPIIVTSQRLGLTEGRPSVFRIFLTPKHQAEAVARYAVQVEGHSSLGILYPDDAYGQAMLGYFRAEVERLGAALTITDSYDAQQKNWSEAVNRLTGGQSVRRASTEYQAHTDFTALYMPDSASVVAQILPMMAFHDVTKMEYLGSPLWLAPSLPATSGRYLIGSVIPEPYSALSQRPESVSFSNNYQRVTGRVPDQFAAYGYDAGIALITAFSTGATSRDALIRSLSSLRSIPGVTGPFSFSENGDFKVEPALVTVEDGAFKLLREPAEAN